MKKPLVITSCCILLALSGAAPLLTAQEKQSESTEQQNQTEATEKPEQIKEKSQQSGEADDKESASTPRNATGGFRPSEEISEDLSVSFPVDI